MMKTKEIKSGISLITLVITIIIIIILASAVLLTMNYNNPIENAKIATFMSNLDNYKSELMINLSTLFINNTKEVNASGDAIKNYIPSFDTNLYKDKFAIINNELIYIGNDEKEKSHAKDVLGKNEEELYESSGLILHYDGKNNTGTSHDSKITTWKDLSGNDNDGTLNNFTFEDSTSYWKQNGLRFSNSYVAVKELNYPNVTLEVVVEFDDISTSEITVMSNFEWGGYGIQYAYGNASNRISGIFFNKDLGYQIFGPQEATVKNKKYSCLLSIDNGGACFIVNGKPYYYDGTTNIKYPDSSTILALGGNPVGNNVVPQLNGTIYSVRMYNRALTEEELLSNYNVDKIRFHLE